MGLNTFSQAEPRAWSASDSAVLPAGSDGYGPVPHPADGLLQPLWMAEPDQLRAGIPHDRLAPAWQLLVLGDGYTTRNLQLLTRQSIQAHVLDSRKIQVQQVFQDYARHQEPQDSAQDPLLLDLQLDLQQLGEPLIQRQVWLSGHQDPTPLLYATSWWDQTWMDQCLPDQRLPIGQSLVQARMELFRELRGVYWGQSEVLIQLFQQPGPFWGRHYFLWAQHQPLTLIYEVFSPILVTYLGSAQGGSSGKPI